VETEQDVLRESNLIQSLTKTRSGVSHRSDRCDVLTSGEVKIDSESLSSVILEDLSERDAIRSREESRNLGMILKFDVLERKDFSDSFRFTSLVNRCRA